MSTTTQYNGRVFTKSTPLLIEEWEKYRGISETGIVATEDLYFSNFGSDGCTGLFVQDHTSEDPHYWDDTDSREVTEQEFLDIVLERATKNKDDSEVADMVEHPKHYTSGDIECINAIKASMSKEAYKGFLKGQILKYSWRYENKFNPLEDIKKLLWYGNKLKEELEDDGQ